MKFSPFISRRGLLGLGACAAGQLIFGRAMAEVPLTTVVELFTSQGCSSCPPADEVLTGICTMPGVVALAYHVDYWDYLGWRDTLATPEFSQRQYDYAKARGDMDVYTPQAIVNGGSHYVGSHKANLLAAVDRSKRGQFGVPVALTQSHNEMAVEIGEAPLTGEAMVWLMPVQAQVSVSIQKGENAGRTMDYRNVVRRIVPAGMWSGTATTLRLPADAVLAPGSTGCVALVQRGKAGPILGVATSGVLNA